MKSLRLLLIALLLVAGSAALAAADTQWVANLSGANEVPPNASPATGTFQGTLDVAQNFTYTLTYINLSGPPTASHLHRAPVGVNGSVVYPLPVISPSPANGVFAFHAADFTDLQNSNFYCNVHSQAFPGGEIRGQLITGVPVQNQTWSKIKALFH